MRRPDSKRRWHRRRRSTAPASEATRLVEESEAYLNGTLASRLRGWGDPTPSWVLLNTFAHGDLAALRGELAVADPPPASSLPSDWGYSAAILAEELVSLVQDDAILLRRIQQAVLVPLEFALMAEQVRWIGPRAVVNRTRAALRAAAT